MRLLRIGFLFMLVSMYAALVAAQSAPDRQRDVETFMNANVHRFNGTDDRRREVLFDLIRHLNVQDNGQWGALQKTERVPPFIPADIIVWRTTREHFDVLTDTGAIWRAVGPLTNHAWIWLQVEGANVPPPRPPPPPVVDLQPLLNAIAALHVKVQHLEAQMAKESELREWRLQELGEQFMQHKTHDPHYSDCKAWIPWLRLRVDCELVP